MKILALDTSSSACSIALLHGESVRLRHEVAPLQHARCILSYLDEMVGDELDSLDALAWGCGPGSFTGLRIAAAVVQALGFAYQLPVINVSSLAALAQTAYQEQGFRRLLVAVDARMNEVYWGLYHINEQGYAELLRPEGLCPPQVLQDALGKEFDSSAGWCGVGNAWSVYQARLADCLKNVLLQQEPAYLPKALAVAQLGRLKYQNGQGLHSFDALPTYLRDNVCKISKGQ